MRQIFQVIIIGVVACLIAFPILAYMGINTPLPFSDWGHQIVAFFSDLNLDKITTSFWALIGGTGIATGIAGALAYAYTQIKGTLKQTQTSLSATKQQASSLLQQTDTLNQEKAELQENSNNVIKQITAEKEEAVTKAKEYEVQLQTAAQKAHDQEVAMQTLSQQKVAEFTSKLPSDSVIKDAAGNTIKTVTQILVK